MMVTPTPVTAALAGVFSALVGPFFWSRFGSATSTGSVEQILATLLVVAFPAHAFVVGFSGSQGSAARTVDTALLKRIAAWLGAAAVTSAIGAAFRG